MDTEAKTGAGFDDFLSAAGLALAAEATPQASPRSIVLELGASNPQIPGRGPLRTLHATMDLSGPMRADGDSRRPRLGQEEEGERLREVESRAARHRAAAEEEAAAAAMRRSWGQAEAAASNAEALELLENGGRARSAVAAAAAVASAELLAAALPGPPEGDVAPSSADNDARPLDLSAPLPADLELDLIWSESDERLGVGASGQVFKATWRQGRTAVAVKLWNTEALGEGGAGAGDTPPASLLHEIAILRRLMHPNMCAGHACGWGFIG